MRGFGWFRVCFGVEPQHYENHQPQYHQGDGGHKDQKKIIESSDLRHVIGRRVLKPQLPGLGLGSQCGAGKKSETDKAQTDKSEARKGDGLPKSVHSFSPASWCRKRALAFIGELYT